MLVQEKLEEKNIPCARGASIKVVVEVLSSFPFCIAKKKVKNNLLTRRWGSGVWLSSLHVDMSQWWCGGAGGAVLSSTVMVVGVSGAAWVTVIGEGDRGRKKDVKFNFTKSTQSRGVGVSTNWESFLTSKCETSDHPSPLASECYWPSNSFATTWAVVSRYFPITHNLDLSIQATHTSDASSRTLANFLLILAYLRDLDASMDSPTKKIPLW